MPSHPLEPRSSGARLVRLLVRSHAPAKTPAHGPVMFGSFIQAVRLRVVGRRPAFCGLFHTT